MGITKCLVLGFDHTANLKHLVESFTLENWIEKMQIKNAYYLDYY